MRTSRRFKAFVVALAALCLTVGLGSAVSADAQTNPASPSPQLLEQLRAQAKGAVTISTEDATKFLGFIRVERGGDLLPGTTGSPEAKAQAFLNEYGALLGLVGAGAQLVHDETATDARGTTVTYNQVYNGVGVFGGTVNAHVDKKGALTSVNGTVVPNVNVTTAPKLSPAEAGARAIAHVIASPPENPDGTRDFLTAADLTIGSSTLLVYRVGLVKDTPGTNQLVYELEVTNRKDIREFVYVHAHAGKVLNRFSGIGGALFRRLFEANPNTPPVWVEGDPFPGTLNQDQQNIVNFSGQTYWLFFNAFGRDSWDGAGAEMQAVNNDPRINCPNANWNGITTNYCTGVTGDDTVAHEWGHAYTERTHNLIYQWQPGALNEAYSDIWGEVVDLVNGQGTDSPGGVRTVGACSTHTPEIPVVVINSPASIARICPAGTAAFGPPVTSTNTVTGNVVIGLDESNAAGPSTTDGCTAFTNAAAVAGKVAMVDRGTCGFVVKAKNANNAGATAVIIANNTGTGINNMAGVDPTITIPTLMISLPNANAIKGELTSGNPVNVTFRVRGGGSPPEDSYRWLSGEDDPAFGGAIRDMWNPQCLGDPGKVSDIEYHCDISDGGGVHTNSGVPNHGFALLVDGGTYNGQTVGSIGLTKAAHLYWRAQSEYQTETSDFVDHANSLEASCQDLIGDPLTGLSTTSTPAPAFSGTFTAADCLAVTAMIAAVQLRTEPTQCNFQPLLQQNAPALCPTGQKPDLLYKERFNERMALRDWTLTNQGVFAGWPGLNWVLDNTLPGGRQGQAAFAADPDAGNCDAGAGDISGVMRLESPVILLQAPSRTQSIKLTFDHYVATEAGWDGGNLKISINGGAYAQIPSAAFQFNPYNTTINPAAAGNTNPLAGEPGFSGTDGGEVHGSWGETQINLTAMGIDRGDRIRLRFDFGMDGCTGVDGWYVDDIEISACKLSGGGNDVRARPARQVG